MLMTLQRKDVERRLSEVVQGRIALEEPVSGHTTLRVGGPADIMVFPESIEEKVIVRLVLDEQVRAIRSPEKFYEYVTKVYVKVGSDPFREPTDEEMAQLDAAE